MRLVSALSVSPICQSGIIRTTILCDLTAIMHYNLVYPLCILEQIQHISRRYISCKILHHILGYILLYILVQVLCDALVDVSS